MRIPAVARTCRRCGRGRGSRQGRGSGLTRRTEESALDGAPSRPSPNCPCMWRLNAASLHAKDRGTGGAQASAFFLNRSAHVEGYTFEGYRNPDGSVGTRNVLAITTTVQCVAGVVDHVLQRIRSELLPRFVNVDDAIGLEHIYGCGVAIDAPDADIPIRTLRNISLNPNFAGGLMVVGLGCEKLPPERLLPLGAVTAGSRLRFGAFAGRNARRFRGDDRCHHGGRREAPRAAGCTPARKVPCIGSSACSAAAATPSPA
jgi:hypothetical protein